MRKSHGWNVAALSLCGALWAACPILAAEPEELPPPAPLASPSDVPAPEAPDTGLAARMLDFVRFMLVVCDDEPVRVPLVPQGNILSLSMHLTPEGIELLEQRLQDPDALALVRRMAPQTSELLPLLKAGAPLVRDMKPQLQVVLARPNLETLPTSEPSPVLPSVAVIFEPNDAKKGKALLLSTYWAVINGANDLAERDGTSKLKMQSGKRGDAVFAESHFVDPPKTEDERIRYNFTPAIGMLDERCVIATSGALCEELIELAQAEPADMPLTRGPRLEIGVGPAAGLVIDNLRTGMPADFELASLSEAHVDEITRMLRGALDRLPERRRPLANLVERIRERRQGRVLSTIIGGF